MPSLKGALGALCLLAARPAIAAEPPWHHETDQLVPDRGLDFTVAEIDDLADFHGNPADARLVLYVGGNYYFVMAPLVAAFIQANPAFAGHVYWETLPPGLLLQQIEHGGLVTSGNMSWRVPADAYFAGLELVRGAITTGLLSGPAVPYVSNRLAIMLPAGNPGHVTGLADLARPGLVLAMPNPAFEGIGRQIEQSLRKAGGDGLAQAVYQAKVAAGTTLLTRIHHRQTPMWLMQGRAQAGVTWISEAIYQQSIGHPITYLAIPPAQNASGIYAGALVRGAPHPQAARAWLAFIRSPAAMAIFTRYGFQPYPPAR